MPIGIWRQVRNGVIAASGGYLGDAENESHRTSNASGLLDVVFTARYSWRAASGRALFQLVRSSVVVTRAAGIVRLPLHCVRRL